MDAPAAVASLAAELRALGELSDVPELTAALAQLLTACVDAVPSSLGVRMTSPVLGPGDGIQTAGFDAARGVCRASLRLDLLGGDTHRGGPVRVSVLVLAGQAGAFADFVGGADPLARPGVRILRRTIDEDISPVWTEMDTDLGTLDDVVSQGRIIDRAIGVLIERGHLPDEAMQELRRRATASGAGLLDQAWLVLRTTAGPRSGVASNALDASSRHQRLFRPAGRIDRTTAETLVQGWFDVLDRESPSVVVVDLANVTSMDAAGPDALVGLQARLAADGGRVHVRGASDLVATVIRDAGLDHVFPDAQLPAVSDDAQTASPVDKSADPDGSRGV